MSLLPLSRPPTLLPDYIHKVTSYFILLLSCLPRHTELCSQTVCTNKFISSSVFLIFFHTSEKRNEQYQVKNKYSTESLKHMLRVQSIVMSLSTDFCHALGGVYIGETIVTGDYGNNLSDSKQSICPVTDTYCGRVARLVYREEGVLFNHRIIQLLHKTLFPLEMPPSL